MACCPLSCTPPCSGGRSTPPTWPWRPRTGTGSVSADRGGSTGGTTGRCRAGLRPRCGASSASSSSRPGGARMRSRRRRSARPTGTHCSATPVTRPCRPRSGRAPNPWPTSRARLLPLLVRRDRAGPAGGRMRAGRLARQHVAGTGQAPGLDPRTTRSPRWISRPASRWSTSSGRTCARTPWAASTSTRTRRAPRSRPSGNEGRQAQPDAGPAWHHQEDPMNRTQHARASWSGWTASSHPRPRCGGPSTRRS